MKKISLLLFAAVGLFLASCTKDVPLAPPYDAAKYAAIDSAAIAAYLTAHPEITPVKDTLGVKYQVITAGTGGYPSLASTINVSYTGKLLNGNQFDSSTSFTHILGGPTGLIAGWQIVLPHVKVGSKILMIIPSRYAYQDYAGLAAIPPNSVLIFNMELKSIQQ